MGFGNANFRSEKIIFSVQSDYFRSAAVMTIVGLSKFIKLLVCILNKL